MAKHPIAFAQRAVNLMNKILEPKKSDKERGKAARNMLEGQSLSQASKMQASETGDVPGTNFVYSQRSGIYAVRSDRGKGASKGFHVTFMCASWTAVCSVDAQKMPVACSDHRKVLGCYRTRDITADEWQGGNSKLAQMLNTADNANMLNFTSTAENPAVCGMAPNFA